MLTQAVSWIELGAVVSVAIMASMAIAIGMLYDTIRRYRRENRRYQIDELTGLYSSATFAGARERAENDPDLSIVVFDISNFKLVNDAFSHDEGDRVLKLAGRVVNNVLALMGLPRRYGIRKGGDELVVIVPNGFGWAVVWQVQLEFARLVRADPGNLVLVDDEKLQPSELEDGRVLVRLPYGIFSLQIVGGASDSRRTSDPVAPEGTKYVVADAVMAIFKLRELKDQHLKGFLLSRTFDLPAAEREIADWEAHHARPVR
jgi:GGDEF domain-containing protein